jgi:hypothetical protein
MRDIVTPQSLLAHFYDKEMTPERLAALIRAWDSARAAGRVGPAACVAEGDGRDFAVAIAEAVEALDRDLSFALLEVERLLNEAPGAALAVGADLRVLALNDAAREAFGARSGEGLACLPVEAEGLRLLAERVRDLAQGPAGARMLSSSAGAMSGG